MMEPFTGSYKELRNLALMSSLGIAIPLFIHAAPLFLDLSDPKPSPYDVGECLGEKDIVSRVMIAKKEGQKEHTISLGPIFECAQKRSKTNNLNYNMTMTSLSSITVTFLMGVALFANLAHKKEQESLKTFSPNIS